MLQHTAGSRVGKGTYWNFSNGERVDIGSEGILPGTGGAVYYRMPATGIVMLGPILGLLYAAFLPFIGIAMVMQLLLTKMFAVTFGEVAYQLLNQTMVYLKVTDVG